MTQFKIVRELASLERDRGSKRLLLALYSATNDDGNENRYLALSEQQKSQKDDSEWEGTRKGITVRRGELDAIISALQSADFDSKSDGTGLSDREYLELNNFIT